MIAEAVIARAVDRYGGAAAWRDDLAVAIDVQRLSGLVPWLKGQGRTFPAPRTLVVRPRRQVVEVLDYPGPGETITYTAGWVHRSGTPVPSEHHRVRFRGARKLRRWAPEDAVYFFGAALTTYLGVPFILRDAEVVAAGRKAGLDAVWVRFPPEFHSHCRVQGFYFDAEGLLRRHDYHGEILGPLAYGAHLSDDYVMAGGLPVAQRRRVFGRLLGGRWTIKTPLPVLSADLVCSAAGS